MLSFSTDMYSCWYGYVWCISVTVYYSVTERCVTGSWSRDANVKKLWTTHSGWRGGGIGSLSCTVLQVKQAPKHGLGNASKIFQTVFLRLETIMQIGWNPRPVRVLKLLNSFGIMKWAKTWFETRDAAMYFYIINNGSTVNRGKDRDELPGARASTQKRFTFFFIWQAIVRGRLFLQWTFLFLVNAWRDGVMQTVAYRSHPT